MELDAASDLLIDLPAPKRLALSYASVRSRPATLALFALDERLARLLRSRREPIATQLRLAWWRETLQQPPADWPRGDRVLDALSTWRDPSGLAALADGWEALLEERLGPRVIAEFVDGRGQAFACLARELGVQDVDHAAAAARLWALADLAANISSGDERQLVVEFGKSLPPAPPLPASLRPLAVLAGLGAAALERGGGPLLSGLGSTLLALRIGFLGR